MVIAECVVFGGKEPPSIEREALREQIEQRFRGVLQRGTLSTGEALEFDAELQRLLAGRGQWRESSGCSLASIEVSAEALDELRLPLELLRPPTEGRTGVLRCALAETSTVPEAPRVHPEGGRIVLVTADAGGPVPEEATLEAVEQACRVGLHRASGAANDLARGAFDPVNDHRARVSRSVLREVLGAEGDRPGAAVLQIVCHVREGGLCLHDDEGGKVVVDAESFAATLAPFATHLRLVVLVPLCETLDDDSGRVSVEVALALHCRGMASVVAPRVPVPSAAVPGLTAAWLGALLGTARQPPASLEEAVARSNEHLGTHDGLAHLGLRLYARPADGDDTRPLVIRPYRGLLAFEPEHQRFFVGRRSETVGVVERLSELKAQGQPQFVLLVGASGVGKSSLAKAGVVPKLAHEGFVPVLTRPAQHSAEQLDAWIEEIGGERRLVVVVDQLEEVFTETASHQEAAAYLQRLWSLAQQDGIAVVATLRIDALDLGGELCVDAEGGRTLEALVLGEHGLFVQHLRAEALRQVIIDPAQQVGLVVDPGLVDRLCAEALAEPGALPMLELVLDHLWHQRKGRTLSPSAYEDGLAGTLAKYAKKALGELTAEQERQAERILVRIATGPVVELATWRRRSTVAALRPHREDRRADFEVALTALIDARLVVRGELRQVGSKVGDVHSVAQAVESVELAHELLLKQWEPLRRWIDIATKQLAAVRDLERWVADRYKHETTILTPEQIVYIEQAGLLADSDDINGAMAELIEVSQRAVRRKKRFHGALVIGGGVIIFAFAGLTYWALEQRDVALEQKQVAEEKTVLAEEKAVLAENRLAHALDITTEFIKLGDVELAAGNLVAARSFFQRSLHAVEELEKDDPNSAQTKRNLSVSLEKLGNVEAQAGDLIAARIFFQRSLEVAERLAKADPQSAQAQRDLSVSLNKLGKVEEQAGNLAAARKLFQRSLEVAERLAKADPQSAQAQRDLSVSLNKLGEVEEQAGNLAAARELFQRSLEVADGLAKADPQSAQQAQRDLSVSLNKLGEVEEQAGNLAAARELFQRSLEVAERLAKADPQSAQAQRDLSVSLNFLGKVEEQAGNLAAARELFQRDLEVAERLAKADPQSAQAQRDLSVSLNKLGNMEVQAGNLAAARELFQRSLEVAERLAKADSHSAQAQRDLSVSLNKLGNMEVQAGDLAAARELFQRSLLVREGLAKADPQSAQAQRDLSVSLDFLGNVEVQAGNLAAARELFQRSLEVAEGLAKADPHSAQATFDVVLSLLRFAALAEQEGDLEELRKVVDTANKHIVAMDAKGQIDGYAQREQVREILRQADEALSAP